MSLLTSSCSSYQATWTFKQHGYLHESLSFVCYAQASKAHELATSKPAFNNDTIFILTFLKTANCLVGVIDITN